METNYNGHSNASGIYQIRNINNGKVYIGSAKLFKTRFNHHLNSLKKGTHHNKHLQRAFNQDGSDAFIFEVLEVVEGEQSDRLLVEQGRLDMFVDKWEECYNFDKNSVASSRTCFSKTPEETRKLISENGKRLWSDPEFKQKTLAKLKAGSSTPEAREKMSLSRKKTWTLPEHRQKFSKTIKATWSSFSKEEKLRRINNSFHSPEARDKILEAQREKVIENKKIYLSERYENIVDTVEFWDGKLMPRAKLYENANLVSPEGVLYVSIQNLNAFAREFGMTHKESWKLQQIIEGSRWEHKGWIKKISIDDLNSWNDYENLASSLKIESHTSKPHSKVYGSLVSPDGTIYDNVTNVSIFAKEHGLTKTSTYSLLLGKAQTHRGWRRYDL